VAALGEAVAPLATTVQIPPQLHFIFLKEKKKLFLDSFGSHHFKVPCKPSSFLTRDVFPYVNLMV